MIKDMLKNVIQNVRMDTMKEFNVFDQKCDMSEVDDNNEDDQAMNEERVKRYIESAWKEFKVQDIVDDIHKQTGITDN